MGRINFREGTGGSAAVFRRFIFTIKTTHMARRYEYHLLESTDATAFYDEVERLLSDGWELHGSLVAFPQNTENGKVESVRYIQAFVKAAGERRSTGFSVSR